MTDKGGVSFPLSLSVLAVFTVANGLIRAPFSGESLLGFAAALIFGAAFLAFVSALLCRIPENKKSRLFRAAAVVFSVLLIYLALAAADEYCDFVYKAVLPHSGMWMIRIAFALCVLYLAVSKYSSLYKFAFLSFVLIFFVFAVLFLLSKKTFDFKNLASAFSVSRFSLRDFLKYFLTLILPSSAAVLFLRLSDSKISAVRVLCGAAAGAVLCLLPVFDSVLSFGLPLASKLDYPYIDDISTVTAGSLFTRMDAFAYFAFFAAYVFKCALCVKASARLIRAALSRGRIADGERKI